MIPFRRLVLLLTVLIVTLVGCATVWLSRAGANSVAAVKQAPPGAQPNGVSFTIHSAVDPNFCLENTASVANPASEATMSQCIVRDNQHWTFANAVDGSVVVVGSNGDCLTFGPGKLPTPMSVTPCTFKSAERFYYSSAGQIESTSGMKCLQPAQAAQNASVFIGKCDPTDRYQIWQLGH